MKLQRTWVLLMLGLLLIVTAPVSARKWTNSTGKHTVEAELVEVNNGSVKLKKRDGKIITVQVTKLSKADRDYLDKVKAKPVTGQPKLRKSLEGHTYVVWSVAFSPDGKTLASGSRDGSIKLWDVTSGKNIATLKGHADVINSVAFSPDGKTIASGSFDKTVKLWDVASGKNTATLEGHTHWVFSVAFSPDGKTLASGSRDGSIKLWDLDAGKKN